MASLKAHHSSHFWYWCSCLHNQKVMASLKDKDILDLINEQNESP